MTLPFDRLAQTHPDLVVVGSGPAGLPLALEYLKLRPGARVILIEVGSWNPPKRNDLDEAISIERPENHYRPDDSTNKCVGGTSRTWGGRCVSYDDIDFEDREIVDGNCTWDRSLFREVKRHYPAAAEYLDCAPATFDLLETLPSAPPIAAGFSSDRVFDTALERWSLPTRLGQKYHSLLRNSPHLHVVLGCCAERFEPEPESDRVRLVVRNAADGRTLLLPPAPTVLCCGAQESTRILLKSAQVLDRAPGVRNHLGYTYLGHVHGSIASVVFLGDPKKTEYGFRREDSGVFVRRRFQFTPDCIRSEGLLNTAIWLDNPPYWDPSHRNGTLSAIYLLMRMPILGSRLAPSSVAESVTGGQTTSVSGHLRNVLAGLPRSVFEPASIGIRRYLPKRKLPGVFLPNRSNTYSLRFHAEQVPHRSNRLSLKPDGHTLSISYGYRDADARSVIRAHQILDEELRRSGAGRVEFRCPPDRLVEEILSNSKDGIHQAGTTRMARSPEYGVVDFNLRVFGTSNAYVCSSSTFPTSGQANPTFFLTACAVRLAHWLAGRT